MVEKDVATIKERLHNGEQQNRLAKELGVCNQTVNNIKHGKIWSHVR